MATFRDELYYLICGRHLAWGYVDNGPLVAVQARLAETLFGRSLVGLRMLSAIAGGMRVFLTGMLAWALGGRRPAQVLAMIGVTVAACYLGGDSYLSMNSAESMFWMGCLLALMLLERGNERTLVADLRSLRRVWPPQQAGHGVLPNVRLAAGSPDHAAAPLAEAPGGCSRASA